MRFAIDVAFLDGEGRVVRLVPRLRPWRATRVYLRARRCVELEPGALARAGVEEGDLLEELP